MFMDAYGYKFDEELLWINIKNRRQLNELIPYLSNLLKNNKYDYNKVRYQHMDNETNTCGDHVCFFLYNLLNKKWDLDKYNKYMNQLKDQLKISYDDIVVLFTKDYI
jgi:hypothetical protein